MVSLALFCRLMGVGDGCGVSYPILRRLAQVQTADVIPEIAPVPIAHFVLPLSLVRCERPHPSTGVYRLCGITGL